MIKGDRGGPLNCGSELFGVFSPFQDCSQGNKVSRILHEIIILVPIHYSLQRCFAQAG